MPKKRKTTKKKQQKTIKKPRNRRERVQYPSLDVAYNLKTRQDEIRDISSYAGKLNEKDKAWLAKFTEEYVNASFGKKPLHRTKKLRKSVYDRNNARNRDILTRAKAQEKVTTLDEIDREVYKTDGGVDED